MELADTDVPGLPERMAASSRIDDPSTELKQKGFVRLVTETFQSQTVTMGGKDAIELNRRVDSGVKF